MSLSGETAISKHKQGRFGCSKWLGGGWPLCGGQVLALHMRGTFFQRYGGVLEQTVPKDTEVFLPRATEKTLWMTLPSQGRVECSNVLFLVCFGFCFVCLFLKLQCVPAPGSCATGVCDGHVRQGGARAALGLLAMNRLQ